MRLTIDKTWDGGAIAEDESCEVELSVDDDVLVVTVSAPFHGDPAPASPAGPTPRLWEHEVVEIFIAGPNERYLEVELGPHGHHLVLQLDGIRTPVCQGASMEYSATRQAARWRGTARIPRAWIPEGPVRINAYAIHGPAGARRYLCWAPVPGPQPDFHRLHCFEPCPLIDDWIGRS